MVFKKGSAPWNKGKVGVQISCRKGKTLEKEYGVEKAKEIKQLMKKAKVGNPYQKNIEKIYLFL